VNCGKPIPTEVGHAHPRDESIRRETWRLVGYQGGLKLFEYSPLVINHKVRLLTLREKSGRATGQAAPRQRLEQNPLQRRSHIEV
jgi:hypothetical protein